MADHRNQDVLLHRYGIAGGGSIISEGEAGSLRGTGLGAGGGLGSGLGSEVVEHLFFFIIILLYKKCRLKYASQYVH